jgi:hypothetical protein
MTLQSEPISIFGIFGADFSGFRRISVDKRFCAPIFLNYFAQPELLASNSEYSTKPKCFSQPFGDMPLKNRHHVRARQFPILFYPMPVACVRDYLPGSARTPCKV